MSDLSQVSFVLHRPRSLDNVGAVARVIKNFGLGRLILVDPLSYSFDRARKLAVGAEDVLEGLFVHRTLAEALAPTTFSAATTSRQPARRSLLSPAELGARVRARNGPVAIVFGEEKRGLSDEEIEPCHEVCRIPTEPAQPSMNLAQSAAVVAYALRAAEPAESLPQEPCATQREVDAAAGEARRALSQAGFLNPQNPDQILGELTRTWARAALTPREAELWRNAFRKLADELARRG
ncbi:MAG TPA: TrmJ/YjtD family RNA methyltransferase [Myxococcales bacterium]|nr:TrmJ/YjtD family RNA methyltransferase [Myxococcales bacterium]